jgi:hypothetical protein
MWDERRGTPGGLASAPDGAWLFFIFRLGGIGDFLTVALKDESRN